ncbi:UBX domain-containing protein 11-like isoform X2 [Xenia sp. Carnegie-2017]|uniref:UBX domain-containing protein 11-like isoform X2 n=1 Tax=Xenia sp. Carnegie-2017 TaxID=2897299 RepID=UPI001F03C9D3|nr:UBX domain-containing protein 11-like isoform X2 [Xenia sp. Carnegie-2017]
MSSPFESLKNTKKVPLNGPKSFGRSSNAPYRKATINPDEILNRQLKEVKTDRNCTTNVKAPSDVDLLSSMASRLSWAEQQLGLSTREIIEKDKKIKILEEKVSLLEKARCYGNDNVKDLERKCLVLQQQIQEMEEFLSDYGMIWVGSQGEDEQKDEGTGSEIKQDTCKVWNPDSSIPHRQFTVNFDQIIKNTQELNLLNGSDQTVVSRTKAGATFIASDVVPLTLYANGIVMFAGPFRPYTDVTTKRCINDLMDGYFPSELQDRYPDGVNIKVIDRRDVEYKDRRTELLFPGSGQTLNDVGGQNIAADAQTQSSRNKICSLHIDGNNKENVENFLHRLPPSLIENGKIIDVRYGVEETLKGPSNLSTKNEVRVINTPVVQEIKTRAENMGGRPESARNNVTTLRIKSERGDETYILKMKFTDTIDKVRYFINKERPELHDGYRIKTSFPNMVYDDVMQTLEEAGLVPNAILHILV